MSAPLAERGWLLIESADTFKSWTIRFSPDSRGVCLFFALGDWPHDGTVVPREHRADAPVTQPHDLTALLR